jgi:hypothetical protein
MQSLLFPSLTLLVVATFGVDTESEGRRHLLGAEASQSANNDRMVEYSDKVIVGSPPWIKPEESDWSNPRNTQPNVEACQKQCTSIINCDFATFITGMVGCTSCIELTVLLLGGERVGECWLATGKPVSGEALEEKKCGVPCASFKRIRMQKSPDFKYDPQSHHVESGIVLGIGGEDHAARAKASPWSRLMIDAQVNWQGGLSTFSASTAVLHAIRQGISSALRIPMAHIAQVCSRCHPLCSPLCNSATTQFTHSTE